jgi:prevent-host-death family protein
VGVDHDPNHKGNVAELAFAKEAAELGLSVLKPLTEHERYDLVIGIGGKLVRVQCKWGRKVGSVVMAKLVRNRRGPNGFIRRNYSADEIDAFGIYCGELNECFLVPIDVVSDQWSLQLRLSPARNGQRAALHFAEQYRLGAVAQLAERRYGIPEAEGSSPSSSTDSGAPARPACDEVGAHEFRNHFGYYMERAAAGTEVLVRRRGKPYVRLGPNVPRRSRRLRLARQAVVGSECGGDD